MQQQTARITVIPAVTRRSSLGPVSTTQKKRVAAYARVSTDNEEQLTSYEAQVDYYTRHIRSKDEWDFVEVYTDEGISATSTKRRDGFNRMIQDALNGKIDLILTKSVSRFARNTVDTLTTVRQLKEKGVEVYFEKENIYTLDSKGELLITIMSSLAQEESRSISENVTWGQRKRFADGKVNLPYKQFLGYEKGPDGRPKIVEKQAAVVRQIYKLFLEGRSVSYIANYLTESHIPTPSGKQHWRTSTVESILTNEKYKGDAILQKSFTVDFLTKKHKVNEGEVPQYYVENSHSAIVSPELFEMAQAEMRKRKQAGAYSSGANCFAGKIVCGECGSFYGSKIWHSTSKYRRAIWQCNHKFQNEHKCSTPHLYEEDIKRAFVGAFNSLITNKDDILLEYSIILDTFMDTRALDTESKKLQGELTDITTAIDQLVRSNASKVINQEEYQRRYNALAEKYETTERRLAQIAEQKRERDMRREKIALVVQQLSEKSGLVLEFDEELWNTVVERVVVRSAREVIFILRDGKEVNWPIE